MKFGLALLAALLCAAAPPRTLADGDANAGESKSAVCGACHGPGGSSTNPAWPSLAGQHASYTSAQMHAFKSGQRNDPIMLGQAAILSDQDIEDLAAYYAAQSPSDGQADPELADAGQRIYRGGNRETGVSACAACHGPAGRGNPLGQYPAVAGQHAAYLKAQLKAYATGERASDRNQMMRNVAARMSDAEIDAVASYIQGLRAVE